MALFVAEDKVRRATQTVEFSRQMVARGYITKP